ncbi:hypothetical protein [Lactococcus allomyrinae]|uniref:Uncharacterized protein n=1 Tax=Lactococcus allomyrinae TaxID=2419773 RepID=A0A387B7Y1_9LACT|nr:hypothetical protein [Lactococcus allomyrinae]AYF99792.1 hypothetical protein D7I46_01055 [Lactococcus allomyrinae]
MNEITLTGEYKAIYPENKEYQSRESSFYWHLTKEDKEFLDVLENIFKRKEIIEKFKSAFGDNFHFYHSEYSFTYDTNEVNITCFYNGMRELSLQEKKEKEIADDKQMGSSEKLVLAQNLTVPAYSKKRELLFRGESFKKRIWVNDWILKFDVTDNLILKETGLVNSKTVPDMMEYLSSKFPN